MPLELPMWRDNLRNFLAVLRHLIPPTDRNLGERCDIL